MAQGLLYFVHGLGGKPRKTWRRFPKIVAEDPDLNSFDVGFFKYTTGLFRFPWSKKFLSIETLADALRTQLRNRYPDHDPVILVTHSLGGLIARRYLADNEEEGLGLRVRKLLLYAVPNDGSDLAGMAGQITWRHNQLKELCRDSQFLDDLNTEWETLHMNRKVEICCIIAGQDKIVDEDSARGAWGRDRVEVLEDRNHRNAVKPRDEKDDSFLILRNFLLRERPESLPPALPPPGERRHAVIGFDLDGTLIRGLQFSWTRVWDHLGYEPEIYNGGMRRYLRKQQTYEEWCKWAVRMFRARKLKRADFPAIVEGLTLTNNLYDGLAALKENDFVVGLISGGIDTMLYEMIPDADDVFDYIFINKLAFDDDDVVSDVVATDYDFEHKADALELMCQNHGYTMERSVFVGEGFNDSEAIEKAGLSIAYPPRDFETQKASHILIEQDDLMKVVERVLE